MTVRIGVKRLVDSYFDDLGVGDQEITRARTVTETDVVNWCALTGDWFVMHSDKEFAERSVFGQRLVPGLMLVAFCGGLGVPPDAEAIMANYGSDRIRYPRPTFIGDTVHCEIEVAELTPRDDRTGLVAFDWRMLNQKDELVMVCQLKVVSWRNADVRRVPA
ncbi:MaoC family dehydratase [Streptomyces sp. NPDC051677]|uniref:MaoC family dehydratase n=1 Tax=Streptomyces sp. NPDC051677 TaxID=3365669 RepID=UPI0037D03EB3